MTRYFRPARNPFPLTIPACACLWLLTLFFGSAVPGAAVAISPNTTADSVADDGRCSLREAIIAANSDSPSGSSLGECRAGDGADVIFLAQGTYPLSIAGARENAGRTGDLDIHESLEIRGNTSAGGSPTPFVVDANGIDRVFDISSAAGSVRFVGFTIQDGEGTTGELRFVNTPGGGIYSEAASLTLERVLVRDNRADAGGGIYLDGGDVVIQESAIIRNTSLDDGGGIRQFQGGSLWIQRSNIRNNVAAGDNSDGGGLSLRSPYTIWNTTIAFNRANADGGGVESDVCCAASQIRRTLIVGNRAVDFPARGGGVYLATGDLSLRNVTVSANHAGRFGDEIYTWGTLSLRNATIHDETPAAGQVIYNQGTLVPTNTILVGRCHQGAGAGTTTGGGNIESPGSTCGLTAGSDTRGASAAQLHLLPLDSNGGRTLTHYPAPPSIAIDGGRNATCEAKDQRSRDRPQDGNANGVSHCDVGAVEVQPCQAPESLTLQFETETGTEVHEACERIDAGPSYVVASGADVDLRAGQTVALRDGFRVDSGGTLRVEVHPTVGR